MTTENPKDNVSAPPVPEATTTFKVISDHQVIRIVNEKRPEIVLAEISGYDLALAFNMEYINSLEDVEAVAEGFRQLARETVTDILLNNKHQSE